MTISLTRGGLIVCVGATALFLAACGGGGSGKEAAKAPSGTAAALGSYQVVYGLFGYSRPMRFGGTSCANLTAEQVIDKTRWQGTPEPFAFAMLYKTALPSGRILISGRPYAQPVQFDIRYASVIDPITNVVRDYDGSEGPPPDMTDTITTRPEAGWLDVVDMPLYDDIIGNYAQTPSFMIYKNRYDHQKVYCRDAGGDPLVAEGQLVTGISHESFRMLVPYTRP